MNQNTNDKRSPLERVLGLFSEVHAGEGLLSVLMALNVFLLLNAYYVLKPIRDSLIGNATLMGLQGDELKSYLAAVMAFLLIFFVKGYGAMANRLTRIQLLNVTSIFVVSCVAIFYVLLKVFSVSGPGIAIAYFVWLGIINVFIIAQFWSYANDIYTERQGKRLFAVIAIGQSTGAIMGAWLSRTYGKEHTFTLLASSAVVLGASQLLYNIVNKRVAGSARPEAVTEAEAKTDEEPMSKDGGFKLVLSSRYLLFIAFMILLTNVVNTTGEFIITNTFVAEKVRLYPDDMFTQGWVDRVGGGEQALPEDLEPSEVLVMTDESDRNALVGELQKGFGTSFFGSFYFWVNLFGALIQMFIVSRFFKFFGVRGSLFVLPIIAGMGAMFFGIIGSLVALRIWKTAENATDYSLQNTVKQALFLPTSREAKYKAKAAIDTFFVRSGDALSAGLVWVGLHVLSLGAREFAFVNVGLACVWLIICVAIFKQHKKLVPDD